MFTQFTVGISSNHPLTVTICKLTLFAKKKKRKIQIELLQELFLRNKFELQKLTNKFIFNN